MTDRQRKRIVYRMRDKKADKGINKLLLGIMFVVFVLPNAIYLLNNL